MRQNVCTWASTKLPVKFSHFSNMLHHVGVRLGQKFKAQKNLVGNINILLRANINTKIELLSLKPPHILAGLYMLFLNLPVLFFLLPSYRCANVYLYTQNIDLYLFLKDQSGDVRPLNSNQSFYWFILSNQQQIIYKYCSSFAYVNYKLVAVCLVICWHAVISTIVAVLPNMSVAYMFPPPDTEHTISWKSVRRVGVCTDHMIHSVSLFSGRFYQKTTLTLNCRSWQRCSHLHLRARSLEEDCRISSAVSYTD